jgi:uncharacterized membrane protein YfcA
LDYGWVALISLAVGLVGGYAGIAGAPFIIFALVTFLGYSQHSAQGTVLAMMIGPMTILPVIYGRDFVKRRWQAILIAIITYMVFSFAGASIAYLFNSQILKLIFGAMIVVVGIIYIAFSIRNHDNGSAKRIEKALTPASMILAGSIMGLVGGIVGIGAGILLIPYLTMIKGIEQKEAQTMSLAILLPPVSLGAVFRYGLIEKDIIWPVAGIMLAAYVLSSGFGYKLNTKHHNTILRNVLGILLISTGIVNIIMSTRV